MDKKRKKKEDRINESLLKYVFMDGKSRGKKKAKVEVKPLSVKKRKKSTFVSKKK